MEKDIKFFYNFIFAIFFVKITLEKELDWKMITLCASGASKIVMEKVKENLGTICYKGENYLPECSADLDESIHLIQRFCFKKCKENEEKIGEVCYYCDKGNKIIIEKDIFGRKLPLCENENNKKKIKAKKYKPEFMDERYRHCMANTTELAFDGKIVECHIDCGVIGLEPFGDFCATNEEIYENHLKEVISNLRRIPLQRVLNKFFSFILNPSNIDFGQFKIMKNEFLEYLKLDKIYTKKFHLLADLKTRIKIMGRDIFSNLATDFAVEQTSNYEEYLRTVCPKVSSLIYDNIINDNQEQITLKEAFSHYSSQAIDLFFNFFKIDKIKSINNDCFKDISKIDSIDCNKSVLDLIGAFDPSIISSIFSAISSYYVTECDIKIQSENSDRLVRIKQRSIC